MARMKVQIRRRPRPKKAPPSYVVRLSCGHRLEVGPPLPMLGAELVCPHGHADNHIERIIEIRSA